MNPGSVNTTRTISHMENARQAVATMISCHPLDPKKRWKNVLRPRIFIFIFSVCGLYGLTFNSHAAGPLAREFYLGIGGGVFTPTYTLPGDYPWGYDGPPPQTFLYITFPLLGDVPVGLDAFSETAHNTIEEDNPSISLGGHLGYKFTDHWGIQAQLDVGFPNILVKNAGLDNVLTGDNTETANIQILAPDILPIGISGIYTFMPEKLISPYIGIGAIIAFLADNNKVESQAVDIVELDGGTEIGWAIQAGAQFDVSQRWFAFFDVKYGVISDPDFEDREGNRIPVDDLEIRHIRVGGGIRF